MVAARPAAARPSPHRVPPCTVRVPFIPIIVDSAFVFKKNAPVVVIPQGLSPFNWVYPSTAVGLAWRASHRWLCELGWTGKAGRIRSHSLGRIMSFMMSFFWFRSLLSPPDFGPRCSMPFDAGSCIHGASGTWHSGTFVRTCVCNAKRHERRPLRSWHAPGGGWSAAYQRGALCIRARSPLHSSSTPSRAIPCSVPPMCVRP